MNGGGYGSYAVSMAKSCLLLLDFGCACVQRRKMIEFGYADISFGRLFGVAVAKGSLIYLSFFFTLQYLVFSRLRKDRLQVHGAI